MTTPLLLWTDKHRIGIDPLDYEHQTLFRVISELVDELDRHEDHDRIDAALGEIHARMSAHFALEEKFMRDNKYADYAAHKAEHDEFLDRFTDEMVRIQNDPDVLDSAALRGDLGRWIEGHVLTLDTRMSAATR
ncbi:MAG: hemerythrin family protein [Rhodospirillales bacterium]|nr:hemerythrin family protein [Rhodospirillales bacterium]